MNPKFLQQLKAQSKHIINNLQNSQESFLNKVTQLKTSKIVEETEKYRQPIKQYFQSTPFNKFNFKVPKQPEEKDPFPQKNQESAVNESSNSEVSPSSKSSDSFLKKVDEVKKAAQDKYNSLSREVGQIRQSVVNQSKERLEQLSKQVDKQRDNLSKKSKEKINQASSELKEKINQKTNQLKVKKQSFVDDLQKTFTDKKEEALSKAKSSQQSFVDNLQKTFTNKKEEPLPKTKINQKETKNQHFQFLKKTINKLEEKLKQPKQTPKQSGWSETTGKLAKSSEKFSKAVKQKITWKPNTKADVIGKLISKLFWRVALLIGVGAFAYGIGTSLPRELRQHLNAQKKESMESRSVPDRQ